jgi:hypothetical protein
VPDQAVNVKIQIIAKVNLYFEFILLVGGFLSSKHQCCLQMIYKKALNK